MNFISIIEAKRDGQTLSAGQIHAAILEYTKGNIPDYQMAALLMAICIRGCDEIETAALTKSMRFSGDVLSFPADARPLADKHSTGGIGDKVSLPLAPLLACLGFRVPMISGRGLGITGGTLDKLDSIPGFQTKLPPARIVEIVQTVGCVICGQTENMVPADRKLYALRDVTGTVPSIPLVAASILSKKLAEGVQTLILDVKFGSGAFMKTKAQAEALARAMTSLGNASGVKTRALLSRMNAPLGRAAGNWLEVKESIALLKNPRAAEKNLLALVIECAAHLLEMSGKATNLHEGRARANSCLESGEPLKKWNQMLVAQGTDLDALEKRLAITPECEVVEIRAEQDGFVASCDARLIGEAIRDLGGGRLRKEDSIDCAVGVENLALPGTRVNSGDLLASVHVRNRSSQHAAIDTIRKSFEISDTPPLSEDVIDGVVE